MYLKHFGFQQPPFAINPDPRFLYLSPKHQEALAHLLYGLGEGGGFVMLSGEVGTGKTTLCFTLLEHMGENIDVALILNPRLNGFELLASLCDELHVAYDRLSESRKLLIDRLNQFLLANHARGRRTVAVIDEAQNLSVEVLEQIRLLTNLETPTTKLLQIVLVGQPELPELLGRPELRQVDQRITARYHLGSLDAMETRNYIRHRLTVAGGAPNLFSVAAIRAVARLSRGVPRLINVICDRALLGAYTRDRGTVDRRIVEKAYREAYDRTAPAARISAAAAGLFLALAGASIYSAGPWHATGQPKEHASAETPAVARTIDTAAPLAVAAPESKGQETAPPVDAPMVQTAPAPAPSPAPAFSAWIEDPSHNEAAALARLMSRWRPDQPVDRADCELVKANGLRCLRQHSDWDALRRQNLPGLLTVLDEGRFERSVLLVGTSDTEAEFLDGDGNTVKFPALDVLTRWAGDSLVLWEPPSKRIRLEVGMSHPAVLWLRQRLEGAGYGSGPGDVVEAFDEPLKAAVMRFQKSRGFQVDGIAGEKTLAALSGVRSRGPVLSLSHRSDP